MIVDAHHHYWDPARAHYPWMTDERLRRRFGPEDLEPLLREHGVERTVVVQARMELAETYELLETGTFVVGWVDLRDRDVGAVLRELAGSRLVGVRHQVHDEADPDWLLREDVQRGLRAVAEAGLVYDLLVRTRELPAALATARRLPEGRFVLDHLGKPPIAGGEVEAWAEAVAPLSELSNVSCKLSGLVTEAGTTDGLVPFVRRALGWFGPERCLWGSDWPVCTLVASYGEALAVVADALLPAERDAVLGGTAVRVYGLS